ncbi:protein C8orf37-like [Pomacea canaliculata]|uniref:protein C8orf37-like n=1 Tax=Pomacea canaliculata TaxID=400727 RepID=UPI000D738F33|nr:protein C8orf37-like [Pomacea canaliculata]
MADDIDDLLDEVEKKYLEKGKQPVDSNTKSRCNVEDDLNDLLSDDSLGKHHRKTNAKTKEGAVTVSTDGISRYRPESSKKCYPVFLGGSADPTGQGTSISHRTCDQLRCTACDFKVCMFDNLKWTHDTTYLFLRNNVPDFGKLKANLMPSKGSRAYCCQCSWRTMTTIVQLNDPDLKWVCGKH